MRLILAFGIALTVLGSPVDDELTSLTELKLDDTSILFESQANDNGSDPAAGSKPHLAFMLMDDLGWSDTEFGGSGTADFDFVKTPTMKSLKDKSLKLHRQYAYAWCAPSRSSLLSGRIPVHVNVDHSVPTAGVISRPNSSGEGIPAGMKTMGSVLQESGYKTHYIGKWGVGFTWKKQNPIARGFDSFFGYLHDSVDFWNEQLGYESIEVPGGCEKVTGNNATAGDKLAVDLVRYPMKNGEKKQGPAYGENGTEWVDKLFLEEAKSIIHKHDVSKPLFLLHSFHSIHAPLNADADLYIGDYAPPPCEGVDAMRTCFKTNPTAARRSYAAMITWTDGAIGEIINALQDKNMWKTTLMVVSADNGGAQYMSPIGYQLWGSGNNLPLRGGKTSEFEGGIRVNSFVTGGFLPKKVHGHTTNALIQFADWLGTFAYLAGVKNVTDEGAIAQGLPDFDSVNQWPILSGETTKKTLRTELMVSPVTLIDHDGKYKLLTGPDPGSINSLTKAGFVPFLEYAVGYYNGIGYQPSTTTANTVVPNKRSGPPDSGLVAKGGFLATWIILASDVCHNATQMSAIKTITGYTGDIECPSVGMNCTNGCLFDLETDEEEKNDLAGKEEYAGILADMKAKLKKNQEPYDPKTKEGLFSPIRNGANPACAPGGAMVGSCGSDYCSDDAAAYAEGCNELTPCLVCPPGEDNCTTKIPLKGCTSKAFCKRITEETGYYTWALEESDYHPPSPPAQIPCTWESQCGGQNRSRCTTCSDGQHCTPLGDPKSPYTAWQCM